MCASFLGLAATSMVPGLSDSRLVLPIMATEHLPYLVGVCVFLGVLGASMSTANGAILVIAVVLARNIWQRWSNEYVSDRKILFLSRILALPTAAAACWIAYVKPEPGMLLVVAFDFVFAGSVTPLIMGVYWRKATSQGAIACMAVGTVARLWFYFYIPFGVPGLDTLLPPVVSLAAFVVVSLRTQGRHAERNIRLFEPLPEDMLMVEPYVTTPEAIARR
jgi:Na+/proline symporter